jgi:hypothetical protein
MYGETITRHTGESTHLYERYTAALTAGERGNAIAVGREIEAVTASMMRDMEFVEERIIGLFPKVESAVDACLKMDTVADKTGFLTLWANAKVKHDRRARR